MKAFIQILICLACVYAIFMQLLRIVWLYFPGFMRSTYIYKSREPKKTEMLLYYLVAIAVIAFYIALTLQKLLEVEFVTNHW